MPEQLQQTEQKPLAKEVANNDIHAEGYNEIKKVEKKKKLSKKIFDLFISDEIHNLKGNIITNYIVPGIKDILNDILHSSIDAVFSRGNYHPNYGYSRNTQTNYSKKSNYYYGNDNSNYYSLGIYNRPNDIPFNNQGEAERVLDECRKTIDIYDRCPVHVFFESAMKMANMSGDAPERDRIVKSMNYTQQDFGWVDLRGVQTIFMNGKWFVEMPRPINLK